MGGKVNFVIKEPAASFAPTLEPDWEQSEVERLRAQLAERAALLREFKRYGEHPWPCSSRRPGVACGCGLDDLLQRIEVNLSEG